MTDAGASRSGERFRLARRAVVLGTLEKATTSLASLARVPLLLWGLGTEEYGLYVAVLGVVATARLFDFGLHYGVLNAVAAARGRDDAAAIRATVSTGFFVYAGIALVALAVLTPLASALPLAWLLGVTAELLPVAQQIVVIALFALLLPIPFKVFPAALTGFQEQYRISAFSSISMLVQLALLALVIVWFPGQLLGVAATVVALEALHFLFLGAYALRRRPELTPRVSLVSRRLAPVLLSSGLVFFIMNLANLLKFSLGSPVVAHAQGTAAVPSFSVPAALFMTALGVVDLAGSSFWPAYSEAAARGEWTWVARAFSLGLKTGVAAAAGLAVLGWIFGDAVIELWTSGRIAPSHALLGLLALWLVAQTALNATANLLNALHRTRVVMCSVVIEGVATFALATQFAATWGGRGVAGAMALTATASVVFLLCVATPWQTARRIVAPWRALAGIGLAATLAAVAGWLLALGLADTPALVRLLAGATATAGIYAAAAWILVLDDDERGRLRRWLAARVGRRPRVVP